MTNLYMILSSIISNIVWYWIISYFGPWTAVAAVSISIAASAVTVKYLPKEVLILGWSAQVKQAHVVAAAATAVCQVIVASLLDGKVGMIMTAMWMSWYLISAGQYYWAKSASSETITN